MKNKNLRNIIKEGFKTVIKESRMVTYTFKITSDITKKIPGVEKVLGIKSTGNGTASLIRYEDGNAYEIVIKPVKFGDYKHFWGNIIKGKKQNPEEDYKNIDLEKFKPDSSQLNEKSEN